MRATKISAPRQASEGELIAWWNELLSNRQKELFEVDLGTIDRQFVEGFSSLIQACGHRVIGSFRGPTLSFSVGNFVVVETIFADTEMRAEPLDRLLGLFKQTIESLTEQEIPDGVECLSVVYCSVDKVLEIVTISKILLQANEVNSRFKFLLVPYSHPTDGYPEPSNGHVDARVLPNKYYAERSLALFQRACNRVALESDLAWDSCVRVAIDDDDVWLPWAVEEIHRQTMAILAVNGRAVRAIGLANQYIYYPVESGRLDRVSLDVCLTGSKFFVARSWSALSTVTPWMLPERFSANVERQFRHRGIDLRVVRNSRPFLIYIRSRFSLSKMMKTEHYIRDPYIVTGVGDSSCAISAAKAMQEDEPILTNEPIFEIDAPSLAVSAAFDPDKKTIIISGNFEEFLAGKGYDPNSKLRYFVNSGIDGRRFDLEKVSDSSMIYAAESLTDRTILRIEDSNGETVGSAWVRGKEVFLS